MAILFDLDGTLLDTAPDMHTAVNILLQEQDKPVMDYEELKQLVSFGSGKIIQQMMKQFQYLL